MIPEQVKTWKSLEKSVAQPEELLVKFLGQKATPGTPAGSGHQFLVCRFRTQTQRPPGASREPQMNQAAGKEKIVENSRLTELGVESKPMP